MLIVTLLKCMRELQDIRCKKKLIAAFNLAITESELDLSYQNLTLEDIQNVCEALLKNSIVTSLNLSGNNIPLEGAIILANFLKQSTILRTLNLQYNKIGNEGTSILMSVLESSSLTSIDIRYNAISGEGLIAIANAAAISHSSVGGKHWRLEGEYCDEICELFQKAIQRNAPRKLLGRSSLVMNHLLDAAPALMYAYRKTFIFSPGESNSNKKYEAVKNQRIRAAL